MLSYIDLRMEKGNKKMNFVIGWILKISRLEKFRKQAMRFALQDLWKQVDELEVELQKRGFLHPKRYIHLDVKKK